MSALIWPQVMNKYKWRGVQEMRQEFPFRCCILFFGQRLQAQCLLHFHFCRTIDVFILCGRCLDSGGGARLQREKLSGTDKLWSAGLRNTLKETSGVKEPEGLDCVCVTGMQWGVQIPEVTFIHLFICGRVFVSHSKADVNPNGNSEFNV